MGRVTRAQLSGPSEEVARRLLGMRLVHDGSDGRCGGRIVETEAYLAEGDEASHSFRGRTARNASMFLAPGHAYIYLIYGMHLCFNVVTGPPGVGEAVLVRALEPLTGLDAMRARRGDVGDRDLCNGPGKLVQALGFDRAFDGATLLNGQLRLLPPLGDARAPVIRSGPRVGITKSIARPLRYWIDGNACVSRVSKRRAPLQRRKR